MSRLISLLCFSQEGGHLKGTLVGSGPHPGVQPFLRFPTKVPPEARPSPPAQIPIGCNCISNGVYSFMRVGVFSDSIGLTTITTTTLQN